MQQADDADTIGRAATSGGKFDYRTGGEGSPGKSDEVSALTRRGVILGGTLTLSVAASAAAAALPRWDAADWLARWHRLGCGAHGTKAGHPELTPRLADAAQNRAVAMMLTEASADPARLERLGKLLHDSDAMFDNLDPEQRALRGFKQRLRSKLPAKPIPSGNGALWDATGMITWSDECRRIYEREIFA